MSRKTTLGKGLIERIGIDGILNFQPAGKDKIIRKLDIPDHDTALGYALKSIIDEPEGIISDLSEIKAVGHRIVQGGGSMTGPVVITPELLKEFDKYTPLAPLHNPACLLGVAAAQAKLPDIPHVASFDTAYYGGMKEEAFIYGLDYTCYEKLGYRKFGYHGASHKYVNMRALEVLGADKKDLRTISCHIGGGVTLAASIGGIGVDTSVGYGTVCGPLMGTRSGDVDPEVILQLIDRDGYSAAEVKELIYKKSGLLGLSGLSSDIRDILAAAETDNKRAQLALNIFARSIKRHIGALSVNLNGRMDALIFTAGIGENSAKIRQMVCSGLEVLGIKLDKNLNEGCRGESIISAADSAVNIIVIPTDEEMMMAIETQETIRR
jgi:acetate kinase